MSAAEVIDKSINGLKAIFENGGEKSLKILSKIVGNIVEHPTEEKYRKLKMSGKTFKNSIAKSLSAVRFLKVSDFVSIAGVLMLDTDCWL